MVTQNTKSPVIPSERTEREPACRQAGNPLGGITEGSLQQGRDDNRFFDVAVIGAGPAGIMAAISAAKNGAKVVLLEKNDQIGRKILATGNGRCNITNQNIEPSRYHGNDVDFAKPIFDSFDQHETMKFFESIGVLLKEEDRGRMFPQTDKASTVVEALTAELRKFKVEIITGFTVKHIASPSLFLSSRPSLKASGEIPQEILRDSSGKVGMTTTGGTDAWQVTSESNQTLTASKLILTTGGKAAHGFGSSGDGLFWAKNWGHTIVPIHAALVAIETKEELVKEIMGIKLKTKACLLADGQEIVCREGDLLFTHYGVSGPAAMGLAREVDPLLLAGKHVEISIDLVPDLNSTELDEDITNLLAADGKKSIKNVLIGLLPKNLVPVILAVAKVNPDAKAAEISKNQRQSIVSLIKNFRLTVTGVRPLKEAQVTAGGIATEEVSSALESKLIPNLYFAGEILDIDGDSGGFNLQWAWSSGKVAGENACFKKHF